MLVLIANNLPDAVRGKLKLWFIEPKPNVFVSGVKDSVAIKVIDYLFEKCEPDSGILIIRVKRSAPGYELFTLGDIRKEVIKISGLELVIEKEIL